MNFRIEGAMFGASDVGKRSIEHSKRRINLPALRLEVRQERMEQRRYKVKALPSEVVEALAHLGDALPAVAKLRLNPRADNGGITCRQGQPMQESQFQSLRCKWLGGARIKPIISKIDR